MSEKDDRGIVCCFCGKTVMYSGEAPTAERMQEALDHEKVCPRNPYLNELTALRSEVARLRDSLAARDRLIGELLEAACSQCKWDDCNPECAVAAKARGWEDSKRAQWESLQGNAPTPEAVPEPEPCPCDGCKACAELGRPMATCGVLLDWQARHGNAPGETGKE